MTDDTSIYRQIKELVEQEHRVDTDGADPAIRRQQIEEALDQCWDLLRQRQARREAGENPDDATVRPTAEAETEPSFIGIHHVAINVRDMDRSVEWYGNVLGFAPLFPYDTPQFTRSIMRHPSGVVVGLTKHHHPDADADFSERRTGLDHVALAVENERELHAWAARLEAAGVVHSGVQMTPATGSALIAFRDPDNIQLEMYVAQGATSR